MLKRFVILVLLVFALGNVAALASGHHNPAAHLVFVDPVAPQQLASLTEAVTFGDGSYRLETGVYGQTAHLDLRLQNLTPNTTYTLWCLTLSIPQDARLYSAPCRASDGSEMVVRSDAAGNAVFSGSMPALPHTNATRLSMIALAYDLEGHTYGAPRGDIGVNSYMQVFATLPPSQS